MEILIDNELENSFISKGVILQYLSDELENEVIHKGESILISTNRADNCIIVEINNNKKRKKYRRLINETV